MAEEGFNLGNLYEYSHYTNPVTGKTRVIIRKRHDITRSPRLEYFRECMHNTLEGHHYHTGNAREDELAVHHAFTQAAHECAKKDKAYPSDAHS